MKMQISFKTITLCAAALILGIPTAGLANGMATYPGSPASPDAASLRASATVTGTGLSRAIDIEERGGRTHSPIRSYDVDMEKRMHLIVVSGDLQQFMHIHPALDASGKFRITTTFPAPGLYHLYADADPRGFGHAVFRFDVPIEATSATAATRHFSPIAVAALGDYVVRLSTDEVRAGTDTPMLISVMKDGEPASDLHPYLGAYAHIVAIGVRDLSYTHVHAMAMSAMGSGASMESEPSLPASAVVPATMPIHVTLPRAGLYKVWVQFVGGTRVYAAPFVLNAR